MLTSKSKAYLVNEIINSLPPSLNDLSSNPEEDEENGDQLQVDIDDRLYISNNIHGLPSKRSMINKDIGFLSRRSMHECIYSPRNIDTKEQEEVVFVSQINQTVVHDDVEEYKLVMRDIPSHLEIQQPYFKMTDIEICN